MAVTVVIRLARLHGLLNANETARMLPPQRRIRAATLLIAICALGSARALPRALQLAQADPKPDATAALVARFEAIKAHVREQTSLGYLSDARHLDPRRSALLKRLSLAQFALAPRIVERTTNREFVIFDSDRPEATPDIATLEGWKLVADLQNGVKLFRTARHE